MLDRAILDTYMHGNKTINGKFFMQKVRKKSNDVNVPKEIKIVRHFDEHITAHI